MSVLESAATVTLAQGAKQSSAATRKSSTTKSDESKTPVEVSRETDTNADGSVTITITYSDGSEKTVDLPGDTLAVSLAARHRQGPSMQQQQDEGFRVTGTLADTTEEVDTT